MAPHTMPWHRRRLRRTHLVGLAALLSSLSVPLAHAQIGELPPPTIAQLHAERTDRLHRLEVAKAILRQRHLDLADARRVYRSAYADFQRTAAAIYMLMDPPGDTNVATLERLRTGIADARWQLEAADVERQRARLAVAEIDGDIARAQAATYQQAAAQVQARSAAAERATIACPVAQPSAIYNDFAAPRPSGPHRGIDLPAPMGSPVVASWYADVVATPVGGWIGRGVILRDGADNTWWYAHLSEVHVRVGQRIAKGQVIGAVGSTGNSTGPHLHFEIHAKGTQPVDPYGLVSPACGLIDPLSRLDRLQREGFEPASSDAYRR